MVLSDPTKFPVGLQVFGADGARTKFNYRGVTIHDSESEAREELDLLEAAARKKKLVTFVGAGISMDPPANLPPGALVEDPLRQGLLNAACECVAANGSKYANDLTRQAEAFRLESMLDAIQQTHGRQLVEEYLLPLNAAIWNENHSILAVLADAGYAGHCITLNFDCLLESAFAKYGASTTTCPLLEADFKTGSGLTRLQVTKPHGSFAPENTGFGAAELLCGAISEIGDRPSDANRQAIRHIVSTCPVLLVAGYSNHDWDICPILFELRDQLDHIIWIEHASNPRDHEPNERQKNVRELLEIFDVRSTVIVAETNALLRCLAKRLGMTSFDIPKSQNPVPHLDVSFLTDTPIARLRTAAATALMLQNGLSRDLLLSNLMEQEGVRKNPDLIALLTKASGMANYSNVGGMISRMRRVVAVSPLAGPLFHTENNIWLGYQYLRTVIRPSRFTHFLAIPINLGLALYYFRRGIGCAERERGTARTQPQRDYLDSLVARARFFYPAELPHGWAENLMLLGRWTAPLVRPLLSVGLHLYAKATRFNRPLMESEYFWMRHLQAQLAARRSVDKVVVKQRLLEIEHFFCALIDINHLVTVRICQALVEAREGRDQCVRALLDEAQDRVQAQERPDAGYQLRILVYRRHLLGEPSFLRVIMEIRAFLRRGAETATMRDNVRE